MIKQTLLGLASTLIVAVAPPLGAEELPDATVALSAGAFEPGIGYTWSVGTLYYRGAAHPFRISGLSSLALLQLQALGAVYHLASLDDFDGFYTEADLLPDTVYGDLENERGVVIRLERASDPEELTSLLGVRISLER
jgi:hypothetical protein